MRGERTKDAGSPILFSAREAARYRQPVGPALYLRRKHVDGDDPRIGREVGRQHPHRVLEHPLQLTDVAGPGMGV